MQRLLGEAVWDADEVRDDVRDYVVDALGDPDGVLIVDDTGDLKKGVHTVGVQRQYTGTAGRIENAQVAVFLAYAAPDGHTLIDREVYLPKSWTDDRERCAAAGVPARSSSPPSSPWPGGCSPAPSTPACRRRGPPRTSSTATTGSCAATCRPAGVGYVLAVAKSHRVTARPVDGPLRADRLAADLPARAWNRLSAGAGSKGDRDYDWAWIAITAPADETAGQHTGC